MRRNPVTRVLYAHVFAVSTCVLGAGVVETPSAAAVTTAPPPPARSSWQATAADEAKRANERNGEPPRVRIGLRLNEFKKVTRRKPDNTQETIAVPLEALRHTLRARLNKVNHFFVGEWHIETRPVKWVKKSQHYEVQLAFYLRHGEAGQIEDHAGTVDLAGVLERQDDDVFVLVGVARRRLNDNMGQPLLDIVAGFAPEAPAAAVAKKVPAAPAPAPMRHLDSESDAIDGRF